MMGRKKCKKVGKFEHCVLQPKGKFDRRSFRTKILPQGRRLVVGCPKGKYNAKQQRCKVGTQAQKILKPI